MGRSAHATRSPRRRHARLPDGHRRRCRTSAGRSCRPGAVTVLIGGMPAARVGDMCTCVGPPDAIAMGSTQGDDQGHAGRAYWASMTAHGGVIVTRLPDGDDQLSHVTALTLRVARARRGTMGSGARDRRAPAGAADGAGARRARCTRRIGSPISVPRRSTSAPAGCRSCAGGRWRRTSCSCSSSGGRRRAADRPGARCCASTAHQRVRAALRAAPGRGADRRSPPSSRDAEDQRRRAATSAARWASAAGAIRAVRPAAVGIATTSVGPASGADGLRATRCARDLPAPPPGSTTT